MPNTKGAKKRVKVIETKTQRNRMIKSRVKTAIKKFESSLENNNIEEAKENYKKVSEIFDKAVNKGVYHRNKADRQKSKLARRLNKHIEQEQTG
ncbi:30S ribosomal protein S20 [Natranaerofaba carboxydovora]|uniref:30S ribosomal protein S20 n=1 Tax=Natranaerofaba carboxydovora TaxID=2742683 RepID=UPI001F12C6BF|nr:30S ribosomal protein S20 [Natranaerofaba carboxydovora]UMZ73065.1 30S ribosomal protein S20 [Natranaerofaba carboxydovora]